MAGKLLQARNPSPSPLHVCNVKCLNEENANQRVNEILDWEMLSILHFSLNEKQNKNV